MYDNLIKVVRAATAAGMAMNKLADEASELYVNKDELRHEIDEVVEALAEGIELILGNIGRAFAALTEAMEDCLPPDCFEWERAREKEAAAHENDKALARYKAHCAAMRENKARQHMHRRKYCGGANAGLY